MSVSLKTRKSEYGKEQITPRHVSFSVALSELVSLIGPNGAHILERPLLCDQLTLWEHIDFLIRMLKESD